jgi:hypothetical protein
MVLTGANVHHVKRVPEVLDGIVIERPEWTGILWENLCADKWYFGELALETIVLRGISRRGFREGKSTNN